ncbi:hypothetical protein N658DRAFT_485119 [Parathielavia hyrcaniae]|uniref:Uncharacterized protein n=1 Tax=Parathielavia hyrcaniae TaxID=113614 RepID=A0AAN6T3I1_9PEZI|nr:hypothetical protein N658DRAFT_485119 [Parathielavia hyrcaniae]
MRRRCATLLQTAVGGLVVVRVSASSLEDSFPRPMKRRIQENPASRSKRRMPTWTNVLTRYITGGCPVHVGQPKPGTLANTGILIPSLAQSPSPSERMSTEPNPRGRVAGGHNRPTQLDAPETLDTGNDFGVNGTKPSADDETSSYDQPGDVDRPSTPCQRPVSEAGTSSPTPSPSPSERVFRDEITREWLDDQASNSGPPFLPAAAPHSQSCNGMRAIVHQRQQREESHAQEPTTDDEAAADGGQK